MTHNPEPTFMTRLAESLESGYHFVLSPLTSFGSKIQTKQDIEEELTTAGKVIGSGANSLLNLNADWQNDMKKAINGNSMTDEEMQTLIRTKGSLINGDLLKGDRPKEDSNIIIYLIMGLLFLFIVKK